MLCCWVEDPNSEAFKLHLPRIHDYMWVAEDGMKMKVYKYHFPVFMFKIFPKYPTFVILVLVVYKFCFPYV